MKRKPELPPLKAALVRVMDVLSHRMQGYSVAFTSELIRTHGFAGAMKFGQALQKASDALIAHFGDRNAQVLVALAAMWNGCEFCSRGHLYAANIYHYRDTGRLFPLPESDVPRMQRMRDRDALAHLLASLADPEFDLLRGLVERQYALKSGTAEGERDEDVWLRAAIAAWDWLNECTIVADGEGVPPLAPIAKDTALRARYDAARAGAATGRS